MARKGVGLGSTLLVVTIVALLGFALAASSVTHLNLMARDANAGLALDRARSALDLTLAHVYTDPNFGLGAETVTSPGPEGSLGTVTFDPVRANQVGVGVSVNNLTQGTSTVAPDGQLVPVQGLYLQAVGESRGVRRTIAAIVAVPPFPYAIASDGPIAVAGGLVVGSLGAGQSPATPPAQLKPSDLLSNDGNLAISLGPASLVRGSLRAVGQVQVDPSSSVGGKLLTGLSPSTVPNMQIASLDPVVLGQSSATLQASYQSTTFTGAVRRDGNVQVDGDLTLKQALVFVNGDITVTGALSGDGVLVATGNVSVSGQTQMSATQRVAMLAGGKLALAGSGPASSNVRGLLYAENGVSAGQVLVEGAVVARQAQAVQLQDVRILEDGKLLQAPFQIALPGPVQHQVTYIPAGGSVAPSATDAITAGMKSAPDGQTFDLMGVEVDYNQDGNYRVTVTTVSYPSGQTSSSPLIVDNLTKTDLDLVLTIGRTGKAGYPDLPALGIQDPQNVPQPSDPPGFTVTGGGSSFPIQLDPSKILPLEDSARVLLWREG